ncbi:MAG: hypothetical protein JNN08_18130 [Bryobacterales bacterium]|nr:hypothetical protein [Bryobacterales bacterium]
MRRLLLVLVVCWLPVFAEEHGSSGGHGDSSAMWKWINFGFLAALIVYAVAKNAPPFFRQRTADIQKSILEAKRIREEADARAAEVDRKLANIAADIESMRTQAHREMEAEATRVKEETTRMLARAEEHARQEIESLTKHAENELQSYAAQLAIDLARKKVEARMNDSTQSALVDQFLTKVLAQPGSNN